MSKRVHEILKNLNEISALVASNPSDLEKSDAFIELVAVKTDIERALTDAPLTDKHCDAIRGVYLVEPDAPERDRLNSVGGTSGRPRGGAAKEYIAKLMMENSKSENANNIAVSRTLKEACQILADYLGEDYNA